MGQFISVLHIYKTNQEEILNAFEKELNYNSFVISKEQINIDKISNEEKAIYYHIASTHGNWSSIIELNVNVDNPIYLYDFAKKLSSRLNTYVLSFHLHDNDVLIYNLEHKGNSLDGYNSNYQYFLDEPASKKEIISQRHDVGQFLDLLPSNKNIESLNIILNEGFWDAFDNDDLDEDGLPNDDKYLINELDRLEKIGKYLEIFSSIEYPFGDWINNYKKFDLKSLYLLIAKRPTNSDSIWQKLRRFFNDKKIDLLFLTLN